MLPLQQPVGHDTASQTHWPVVVLHSCPEPHEPHAAPPVPHELLVSDPYGWHVPLDVQQPVGHEVASQTQLPLPLLHSSPVAHALQAAPDAPHDTLVSAEGCSQVPVEVQQPGHDVPPHVHCPLVLSHASPMPHALHAAPPVPHSIPV